LFNSLEYIEYVVALAVRRYQKKRRGAQREREKRKEREKDRQRGAKKAGTIINTKRTRVWGPRIYTYRHSGIHAYLR
jgi:hypothetical protein